MTRYVERDGQGRITGSFAHPQPGRAEEALADDDAELIAFENPRQPSDGERAETEATNNPALRGLVRALAKRLGVSASALIAEIKAEAER